MLLTWGSSVHCQAEISIRQVSGRVWASQVVHPVKNLPANAGDVGLIPELGRSLGEGKGNLL